MEQSYGRITFQGGRITPSVLGVQFYTEFDVRFSLRIQNSVQNTLKNSGRYRIFIRAVSTTFSNPDRLIDESRPVNSELIKLGLKPLKQVQDAMQHCLEHIIGIRALGLLEFL